MRVVRSGMGGRGSLRPNNSFKPKLLRYTNNMAGKACHVVGSTTQFGLTQALAPMGLLEFVVGHTLIAGGAGLIAFRHICAWKLSTESIDSPHLVTRWLYRYLIFSFCFLLSSLLVAPLTTWQLIKIQAVKDVVSNQPWLLLVATVIPAGVIYYLNRKYWIWCDPVKIGARKSAAAHMRSRLGR